MKFLRLVFVLLSLCACAIVINRLLIPDHNTAATHFDTLLVLGTPASPDGTPTPEQRERVLEAVREYKSGVAPKIIMTGGAAHNQFVEADTMAAFAISQGVPAAAIVEEPKARNTIQNVLYSSQIMRAHNWHSAEVISSQAHLGRSAMILQTTATSYPDLAIEWRTHPSHWPVEYPLFGRLSIDALEATRCLQIRIFGFPRSAFPGH